MQEVREDVVREVREVHEVREVEGVEGVKRVPGLYQTVQNVGAGTHQHLSLVSGLQSLAHSPLRHVLQ